MSIPSRRQPADQAGRVVVFAPSPVLTMTIEDHDGDADIHLHAGGQGVWQARMVRAMGAEVTLCASFAGETGRVLEHLVEDEGFTLIAVERETGYGAAYIHDRRGGDRKVVVETEGDALSRHELDRLYGLTLREGVGSDLVLLSGPAGNKALPPDVYRRLSADLRAYHCAVMVDLSGRRLDAALQGGVDIIKISDEELLADGRVSSLDVSDVVPAMRDLRDSGAGTVIVTRADKGLLLLSVDEVLHVIAPVMEVVDKTGAGDSFTAATAAALARGRSITDAVKLGAAAGALNVTRHGLGTGDRSAIERFAEFVRTGPVDAHEPVEARVPLDRLADFIRRE